METGTDLKLVRWAKDGCPPIIMDNQYSEILKLINAYTSILKENDELKSNFSRLSVLYNEVTQLREKEAKQNEHLKEQLKEAMGILKGVKFMFSNEANYPPNTRGYLLCKEIEALQNKIK